MTATKKPAHRPRKQAALRDAFLTLRLTAEERERLRVRAAKAKQKPHTYMRVELGFAP